MEMLRDALQQYSVEMKQGCDWQDGGKTHTEESETEAELRDVIFNQTYSSRLTQCTLRHVSHFHLEFVSYQLITEIPLLKEEIRSYSLKHEKANVLARWGRTIHYIGLLKKINKMMVLTGLRWKKWQLWNRTTNPSWNDFLCQSMSRSFPSCSVTTTAVH